MFDKITIKAPQKSTFNQQWGHKTTINIGELVPVHWQDCHPGDVIRFEADALAKFVPLVAPAFARMKLKLESFFVPLSQISDNFQEFIQNAKQQSTTYIENGTKVTQNITNDGYITPYNLNTYINSVAASRYPTADENAIRTGTAFEKNATISYRQRLASSRLLNHMGIPFPLCAPLQKGYDTQTGDYVNSPYGDSFDLSNSLITPQIREFSSMSPVSTSRISCRSVVISADDETKISLNPFRAYQHIWNEYYRDARLMEKIDIYPSFTGSVQFDDADILAPTRFFRQCNNLFQIRPRCYSKDYFNTAVNDPTLGAESLAVPSNIVDLRKQSKLQAFLEKKALCGSRFADFLLQHFATTGDNYELDRPIFLGGDSVTCQVSETLQTSESSDDSPQGNRSGNMNAYQRSRGIYHQCNDYGIFMVLASLVPEIEYYEGLPRKFVKESWESYLFPEFATIGMQSIRSSEFMPFYGGTTAVTTGHADNASFGYQQRYSEYKWNPNLVTGEFAWNLNYFHQSPSIWNLIYHPTSQGDHSALRDNAGIFTIQSALATIGFRDYLNLDPSELYLRMPLSDHSFVNQIFAITSDSLSDHCWLSLKFSNRFTTSLPVDDLPHL